MSNIPNPATLADNMKSATAAYVRVGLWGGELEGIYDQEDKFYALRTLEENRIQLNEIKFGGETIKSDIPWLANTNTQVHVVVEYKGKVSEHSKNNYLMIFLSLDDDASNAIRTEIQQATDSDLQITINKLSVGYIKYNSDAIEKHKEFRKWVLNARELSQ